MSWMLYTFFWVIPRRLNFICWRFGTVCLFHLHRQVGARRMNSAGDTFGVLYGKRFGSEMAWAIRKEGDRVGGRGGGSNTLNTKFFGLVITNSLSWKDHITQLTPKLSKACYVLRCIRPFMSQDVLKSIYYSYFHSLITYGIIFW